MDHYSFSTGSDMGYTANVLDLLSRFNDDANPINLTDAFKAFKTVENTLA